MLPEFWQSNRLRKQEWFDFLHCELHCASQEVFEGGVVRVRAITPAGANLSGNVSVGVEGIANTNAPRTHCCTSFRKPNETAAKYCSVWEECSVMQLKSQ
jgi:hypothetical protein